MAALDLTAFVSFQGVSHDGGGLVVAAGSGWGEFALPAAHFPDLATHYAVTITYESLPEGEYVAYLYSLFAPTQAGYDAADWWTLGAQGTGWADTGVGGAPGDGTATIYFGPGVADFGYVVTESADRYVLFDIPEGIRVTGIDFATVSLDRSDWVQGADQIAMQSGDFGVQDSTSSFGHYREETIVPAPGDHHQYGAGDMAAASLDAADDNDGPGEGTPPTHGVSLGAGYTYGEGGVIDGDRISSVYAYHNYEPYGVRGRYNYWYGYGETMPEGAIGVEWESGQPMDSDWATPVGAYIDAALSRVVIEAEDHTYNVGQPPNETDTTWVPNVTTEVWVVPAELDGSDLTTLPSPPHGQPGSELVGTLQLDGGYWSATSGRYEGVMSAVSGNIDLTPHLEDQGREDKAIHWAVFTRTTYNPVGSGSGRSILLDGTGIRAEVGGGFRDGFNTGLRIQWTFRPPRFRWIYATPAVIVPPIRRVFPRDDGRAGGAPRTYPPSKALQSGIRTTGGYL